MLPDEIFGSIAVLAHALETNSNDDVLRLVEPVLGTVTTFLVDDSLGPTGNGLQRFLASTRARYVVYHMGDRPRATVARPGCLTGTMGGFASPEQRIRAMVAASEHEPIVVGPSDGAFARRVRKFRRETRRYRRLEELRHWPVYDVVMDDGGDDPIGLAVAHGGKAVPVPPGLRDRLAEATRMRNQVLHELRTCVNEWDTLRGSKDTYLVLKEHERERNEP